MLSGVPTPAVRVIHEAVPTEQFRSPVIGAGLRLAGRPLGGVVLRWVLEALKRELEQRADQFARTFTRAAAAEADGVTIALSCSGGRHFYAAPPPPRRFAPGRRTVRWLDSAPGGGRVRPHDPRRIRPDLRMST